MVFQNYALYPHMTVYENIAFPLRLSKTPDDEVRRRVTDASDVLELKEHLERKPATFQFLRLNLARDKHLLGVVGELSKMHLEAAPVRNGYLQGNLITNQRRWTYAQHGLERALQVLHLVKKMNSRLLPDREGPTEIHDKNSRVSLDN
jgi:ABC-type uncharacterized transport system YnjBCD ATPase subunit